MFAVLIRSMQLVNWLLAEAMIAAVRIYQIALSPLVGPCCRFTPSCSHYFIAAVEKHGPWWGALKGAYRICRCNPWGGSGYDPP